MARRGNLCRLKSLSTFYTHRHTTGDKPADFTGAPEKKNKKKQNRTTPSRRIMWVAGGNRRRRPPFLAIGRVHPREMRSEDAAETEMIR